MKIQKLTDNTYRVRKQYKGTTYTVYFDHEPDDREALLAMSEKLQEVRDDSGKGCFEVYCDKYIESKRNVLSPSTLGGYQKCKRCLSDEFKSLKLYAIEQIDIQNEINNYTKDHSPKSVRNLHGFISAVLRMFRPTMTISTALPQKKKYAANMPTTEDVKKILAASEGTPYHIPFQLAVLGMRRSEIAAAKTEDLHGNYLTINKTRIYDEDNHITTRDNTKTEESTREIYLPDELVKEIQEAGTIFDLTPPMLVKTLHKYQDMLGIERFRLHDFRHYYASYSHSIGIPDAFIQKAGGWKTDYVMKNVYRDAMKDQNEEMQKKVVNGLLTKKTEKQGKTNS